jgi:hypothetical protein
MSLTGWIAFAALAVLNALFLWGWKPSLKSYMTEKGKRLATREDIENVLSEVRAVTKETETIKAQIGSDLWLRQTIWNHNRDAYTNINIVKLGAGNDDTAVFVPRNLRVYSRVTRPESGIVGSILNAVRIVAVGNIGGLQNSTNRYKCPDIARSRTLQINELLHLVGAAGFELATPCAQERRPLQFSLGTNSTRTIRYEKIVYSGKNRL